MALFKRNGADGMSPLNSQAMSPNSRFGLTPTKSFNQFIVYHYESYPNKIKASHSAADLAMDLLSIQANKHRCELVKSFRINEFKTTNISQYHTYPAVKK